MDLSYKIYDIEKSIIEDYRFTDTRVGTDSIYEFSNGNTLPLMGSVRSANYFALQNDFDKGSRYFNPKDKRFEGFRLTHQPSPRMGDFSYLTILPYTDKKNISYDIGGSIFRPNFNIIKYEDDSILRIASDIYSGIISFSAKRNIKFNIKAPKLSLEKRGYEIFGKVSNFADSEDKDFTMYFIITLDTRFKILKNEDSFDIITDRCKANLYISTSFISYEMALLNHLRMDKDYETILTKTTKTWRRYFDKFDITIDEDNPLYEKFSPYNKEDQRKMFYHCVYRAFLFPMTFYEIDKEGDEIHYNTLSKKVSHGKLYTNVGFRDLQKTLFPLLTLVAADDMEDILEGILNSYKDTGFLPKWLSPDERSMMPGTLVDNVIADALSKGIGKKRGEELLEAMINSAKPDDDNSKYGRFGANVMNVYGYIPADFHESVNQTLDNTLSDFSIGKVAEILGKDDLAKKYYEKSKAYINLFDKETGRFRAKDRDGNFIKEFNPYDRGSPYTEGSAFQNSFNVYHDFEKVVELFESPKDFEKKLDEIANSKSNFDVGSYGYVIHEMKEVEAANFGQIGISNQPSFHLPYLYHYVNKPYKTQILVKELLLNYFKYDFKGFAGDEDNGSLASRFILSSIGIYPVSPGKDEYIIGMPFWDKIKIKLSNGNTLIIKTEENYHQKKFIIDMKVDGKKYDERMITHEHFINAKEIDFTLGLVPER